MVKILQEKDWHGRFIFKSDDYRHVRSIHVRSIRVMDEIWEKFGEMALERGITRVDLLEEIVKNEDLPTNSYQVINLLQEALKLKANAGGAIKKKIKEVLLILDK